MDSSSGILGVRIIIDIDLLLQYHGRDVSFHTITYMGKWTLRVKCKHHFSCIIHQLSNYQRDSNRYKSDNINPRLLTTCLKTRKIINIIACIYFI